MTPVPNQNGGPVTITLTVSDGATMATDTFSVTVTAVADAPTITDIANQTIAEDTATSALAFTVGDADGIGTVTVSASSNNQTLVPDANLVLGGAGANRTVTVTPAANQNGGPVTITVTVSDGGASTNDTFDLTITARQRRADDRRDRQSDRQRQHDRGAAARSRLATSRARLPASPSRATSSNPTLVPNGNIVFGGSGANRTVTIAPLPDQAGQTTITVSVSDGSVSTPTSFLLTFRFDAHAATERRIRRRRSTAWPTRRSRKPRR